MPDYEQLRSKIRQLPSQGAWIYLPIAVFLLVLAIWAFNAENDLRFYWLDPAVVVNTSPWIGLFSNIGNFLWWIAGVISIFTALLLWRVPGHRDHSMFLLGWGSLTAVLALDDFFMIHEWFVPNYLSLPEDTLVLLYVVIAGMLTLRFRELIWQSPYPIFVFAVACFGASIVIDILGPARFAEWGLPGRLVWNLEYIIEDGLKLVGIIAWGHYFGLYAFTLIRRLLPAASDETGASANHVGE